MLQYSIKLLEESKYHVKHQKERKEASFFHCQDRRGGLGKNQKNCIIEINNMLKSKKKVVNEKVFKSKKPKKYAKNCRFNTPEGRFLR